jgi:predicted DCC family thiol-disulfide oxidoreductase YuxK
VKPQRLVFFDGYCNLCNTFLDFLIRRDHRRRLFFASLQGTSAKEFLSDEERTKFDSVLFYDSGKVYYRSTAALKALIALGGIWKVAALGYLIPSFIRDWIYDGIARKRFAWFGRRETCRIPSKEESEYLLP